MHPLNFSNSCNATCNADCSSCNLTLCMSCIASNSQIVATGGCQCKAGYYNISTLNTTNACIPCNSTTFGVDCNCDPLCITCYGPSYYQCYSCTNNSFSGICINTCPLGYISINKSCILVNNTLPVIRFLFQSVGDCYFDSIHHIKACTTQSNNSRLLLQSLNPITSYQRGVYFSGSSSLKVNLSDQEQILGSVFSISS